MDCCNHYEIYSSILKAFSGCFSIDSTQAQPQHVPSVIAVRARRGSSAALKLTAQGKAYSSLGTSPVAGFYCAFHSAVLMPLAFPLSKVVLLSSLSHRHGSESALEQRAAAETPQEASPSTLQQLPLKGRRCCCREQ